MADLVVGLSKTVVQGALTKVQAAINDDAKLRQKSQRDLVHISLEFEMIRSFLTVANETSIKNKLLMTWVGHVRELAYDLEDCVELVVHLDGKPIFWRRLLPSCVVGPLPLDMAVAEIEELRNRTEELSKSYLRYSHITVSAGSELVMLQQPASSSSVSASGLSKLLEASDAATRRKGFVDLEKFISIKDDDAFPLRTISLWGTAGDLGKTSIIRKAYNNPDVCRSYKCRAWVKLMHPFDPHEFIRRFMAQVYANSSTETRSRVGREVLRKMEASKEDLLNDFVKRVNKKRYFVVLEDLSNMVDWDAVRIFLPDTNKGSCIIVSTQKFEIASLCVGSPYRVIELEKFSADHSVYAFFNESLVVPHADDNAISSVDLQRDALFRAMASDQDEDTRRVAASEWITNYPLIGRESLMKQLSRCTTKAGWHTLEVISVWGTAGAGKSALVQTLLCTVVQEEHFVKYRWVDVSHPFDLRTFCGTLLQDSGSETDRITGCRRLLEVQWCLIVIDEIRSREEWDLIKSELVSQNSVGVIIVITTEASIARYCSGVNEELVFNVGCLEANAAVQLFDKEVQLNNNPASLLQLHTSGELKELILKCGGVPKVIVAHARVLATKTLTWTDTVSSLNERFIHHQEADPEFHSLHDLVGWMRSILYNSSDSLTPCIFYLSIFPRNHIIRHRRLIRRWIAEGYCKSKEESFAEKEGEKHLLELLELTIIHEPQRLTTSTSIHGSRTVLCHGFIREYIISHGMEDNIVFELEGSRALTQGTGRHLTILEDWYRDKTAFESIDFSRLRSLTVFGKWESFFISGSLKLLRVLDLEDASGVKDDDLEKMVKQLRRLKFLSLRRCHEICYLPDSLGELRQLQTLDVRGTSIVTLPTSITKCQKLQYIRAGRRTTVSASASALPVPSSWFPKLFKHSHLVGVEVPEEIGELTGLHTLGVVNVAALGGKAIAEELKNLTQLRKLGVSGINRKNVKFFASATSGHVHLESLSVSVDKYHGDCLNGISLPLENLQSLKLYGLEDTLPLHSLSHRNTLTKLDLKMDTLRRDDIGFLARLPQLSILCLCIKQRPDCELHFYDQLMGCEVPTFEMVKILEIACSSSRLHITFGSMSMRNLELLTFDCSSALYQLTGLNDLSQLKQVLLKGTTDEALKIDLESQLDNHPSKPDVKLM